MQVYHSDDYYLHAPKYEYYDGQRHPYAEVPERITRIIKACQELCLDITELTGKIDTQQLSLSHDSRYIDYIRHKCLDIRNEGQIMPSNFIRDTYTPLTRNTYDVSLKSAYVASYAAQELLKSGKSPIYALCRPPGHHAERNAMGGYCYFNNSAIAAEVLSKQGRVAVLDIDYHHGNGTQAIFYDRSDVLYVSLHASPEGAFPYLSGDVDEKGVGDGFGFNYNFPIGPELNAQAYVETLKKAVTIVNDFNPEYIVLSLGFDTYEMDPIGGLGLSEEIYSTIGELIRAELKQPLLVVQEGGYNIAKLQTLAKNFLSGLLGLTK